MPRTSRRLAAPRRPRARKTGVPTRERLLFAAMELFHSSGYAATSVEQVLARARVNSGSLYHYFSGKEDLLVAVLDTYRGALHPIVMAPGFARTADPIARIFEVLADYRVRLLGSGLTYRCPIGRLALEVGDLSPAVRRRVAANFEGWRAEIRGCLEAAGPRLPAGSDLDSLATLVLTVLEGGVMQAAAEGDVAPFDRSVAELRRYLGLLESSARKGLTRRRRRR